MGAHREPARIHRVRAGGPSRGVTTPVSRVYLPVSLTAPGPSGSARPTRLCRGCSRPPRDPGSGFLQLYPAATTALKWKVFHLHPETAAPRGAHQPCPPVGRLRVPDTGFGPAEG